MRSNLQMTNRGIECLCRHCRALPCPAAGVAVDEEDRGARKVLVAWLAGNLFLGSQICWVLRSFIWDSARPTRFIGREYFRGTFYETLFEAVKRLLF